MTPKQIAAIITIIIGLLVILGVSILAIPAEALIGLGIMVAGIAVLVP